MWATIYKNGHLRFSVSAAKKMDLKAGEVCLVSEIKDNCLAIVITALCDCRNFRIQKNRKYFYVNIRSFLYSRGIDYTKRRITYDISETGEALCSYPIFVLSTRTGQAI